MLKIFLNILFLSVLTPVNVASYFDEKLIKNYLTEKHSTVACLFACFSHQDRIDLLKKLTSDRIRASFFDVNNLKLSCRNILNKNFSHLAVIFDCDCQNAEDVLKNCGVSQLFDETHHWLLVTANETKTFRNLAEVNLNINSDVHVAISSSDVANVTTWKLIDIYNPAFDHDGKIITRNKNNFVPIQAPKYWRRKNMTGIHFRSAIVMPQKLNIPLETYLANERNKEINSMHRFQNVAVRLCAAFYNFTLSIKVTNSWGYIQSNGVFNGLVRLLEEGKVDFGSSPLICKYDRLPVVDYSVGSWILRSAFIFRAQKNPTSSIETFLSPLKFDVWLCVVCLTIAIVLMMALMLKVERKLTKNKSLSWSYLLVLILGVFCQQGCVYMPRLLSGRVIVVFFLLFSLMLYQFYSDYIISYLLMDPPKRINNLKDLLDSSLKAGCEDILIDRDYFVQTTDPIALELFQKKLNSSKNKGFYSPDEGMELVHRGSFAFHVETSSAYPIITKTFAMQAICQLGEVQMYRTQRMYTNLQKHSPFREMLTYCMMKLEENGHMDHLRQIWDAHKPVCIKPQNKITAVGLLEFSCALLVLLCGFILSLFIYVLEISRQKKQPKKITFKVTSK